MEGSFLQRSHLLISTTLRCFYFWAFNLVNHSDYHRELELANKTIVDSNKNVREISAERILQQPPIIGRFGHIVEIDESLLVRRKFNVGHLVR